MDINTLRGLATVFAMIAFLAVCFWAYSSKRKKQFDEAANLPFADELASPNSANQELKHHE
ncbi:CcoQ/FixQ family Cbb3-type cytochrome c oxidase assembly chaperone [Zooshikella marina]|uniref:CcoQ/FixQ family Cbb3-type cytochrome c oxidase assembly chaperone n=1 Tax=Zooshikella ganghwensis TaxID=202772 RepID=A0A4P9VSP3_9GAMM|nr:CcoQ/FixQ family Cbb3-type cytochrome c oxidase assembly chaperone [Zooshikella ganghwensis]MBU2704529.1 CcoQ/FixQ family Cbb3-type cytochrome c oxidase assembly chaperone [Zooshikella ganghwensis]RDH46678.1 CcoQ/FixQ family Cbb3-type cytochrome c oxidase assembly chaperone [Zooshikella ganghwensis]